MLSPLSPLEADALLLSLKVAFWAVLCSLPFGVGLAWVLSRLDFPGKSLLDGLLHLPLVLPPVVIGYLLLVALGRNGFIGKMLYEYLGVSIAFTWKGAVAASAVMAFPLLVRAVRLSFGAVDTRLEMAARTLGAGPWRVFFTVTLPLSIPGVIAGMVLAFARSLGEFGATITFVSNIPGHTQTLPLALYTMTQVPHGDAAAMRLCCIAIVIALLALVGANQLEKRLAWHFEG
ncbi:MAG: molybdate ABC transporter permease subunit [Deltaproteobacteria bacterium]|jgi:molybdate transport system permease protein|nr:molybdate ABC transporter permease subunit [Deltaproteobacteria bacterium]